VCAAIRTQCNLRLVQNLLESMQRALERGHYEHVGSQQLWRAHHATVDKLQARLDSLHIHEVVPRSLTCLLIVITVYSTWVRVTVTVQCLDAVGWVAGRAPGL